MYIPRDCAHQSEVRFVVYLSPQLLTCFLMRAAADSPESHRIGAGRERTTMQHQELAAAYHDVLTHRGRCAYPYLQTTIVRPAPNESNLLVSNIQTLCDQQIDAFVFFRCKQMLNRRRTRKSTTTLTATGLRRIDRIPMHIHPSMRMRLSIKVRRHGDNP